MENRATEILNEYDKNKQINIAFTKKLESFISEILSFNNIHIHTLTSRVKERNSLTNKIIKKENYITVNQITDVCGIRITTYYEDDIPKISDLIEKNFKIDYDNSVNKKESLEPSTFGYLSQHYVISFNDDRDKLIEYTRFKNLKAEIQIRSILQHAWAEIEHDLGYKSKIPDPIRRRFSMLAGLLELADREFIHIKKDLKQYEYDLPKQMKDSPESVKIDKLSLKQFIINNTTVKQIEEDFSKTTNIKTYDSNNIDMLVNRLDDIKIYTISDLEEQLINNKKLIAELLVKVLMGTDTKEIAAGISIYYLFLVLVAKDKDIHELTSILEKLIGMKIDGTHETFVEDIISVINKSIQNV